MDILNWYMGANNLLCEVDAVLQCDEKDFPDYMVCPLEKGVARKERFLCSYSEFLPYTISYLPS